jgi:hypothetical protein
VYRGVTNYSNQLIRQLGEWLPNNAMKYGKMDCRYTLTPMVIWSQITSINTRIFTATWTEGEYWIICPHDEFLQQGVK